MSRSGRNLIPARLTARDVTEVGSAGLRGRPMRVVLSALGIAIGIATMIAVVGISSSSKAKLMQDLDKLGTNMLVITPGQNMLSGDSAKLPEKAPQMVGQIDGVEHVGAVGTVDANIYRSEHTPATQTNGLSVQAASESLLKTLRGSMGSGRWLNAANSTYPAVVLGDHAASRLGVTKLGQQVYIDGKYFTVVGILGPLPLAEEIRTSALIGWDAAKKLLGFDGHPTSIYERSADDKVEDVRDRLQRTANPQAPHEVQVSNPSDALAAKAASEGAFTKLLLGLGGVSLLVGGVGVANTMIISVLERRHEIGLRRSLGATQGQIRLQFVTESLMLSGLGGIAGVLLGSLATWVYASTGGMPWVVPPMAMAGGFVATLAIGTVAGLYPAVRAARLSPTLALHAG
ncbi:ABC transporter permease [Streptomyces sp. H27-C3]|uniref:ABC transporter permease n=1 Tax=Streptomyces sp. H27-C3 TaxID=3046305 RepID=UPI0024BB2E0C|nr:ABC transporter permease [Streptomyces sp. H27-C3]MDJ0466219.1 ABC transporter permease [Streptomyces sp. H27-C3]